MKPQGREIVNSIAVKRRPKAMLIVQLSGERVVCALLDNFKKAVDVVNVESTIGKPLQGFPRRLWEQGASEIETSWTTSVGTYGVYLVA